MFKTLSNLIKKRFYSDREAAIDKIDVCFAMNKITEGQYTDLMILVNEYYPEENAEE